MVQEGFQWQFRGEIPNNPLAYLSYSPPEQGVGKLTWRREYRKLRQAMSRFLLKTSPLTLSITLSHSYTLEVRAAAKIAQNQFSGTFANFCPVANNIEKLNTNDSVIDACVRLWVIADFFILEELQDAAVAILEEHCDEKMKVLCVAGDRGKDMFIEICLRENDFEVLLAQLFRGVETAYEKYPHSMPCQQVLVSFFHAVRFFLFADSSFSRSMSKAPHQFSHELLMATIDGRESKWVSAKNSEFLHLARMGNCTGCNVGGNRQLERWAIDPSGESKQVWELRTPWRCISCFERHGLKHVDSEDEEP